MLVRHNKPEEPTNVADEKWGNQIGRELIQAHSQIEGVPGIWTDLELCRAYAPRGVPRSSVVVQRDGSARQSGRMIDRLRVAVKRSRRGIENNASVEDRFDAKAAFAHRLIPDFEISSVFLFPLFVQVDQNVETTLKLQLRVTVEIGMDVEVTSLVDLMKAPASKVGVRNQTRDASQIFEKSDEGSRIKGVEKHPSCGRHILRIKLKFKTFLAATVRDFGGINRRKFAQTQVQHFLVQEILQNYMWEWFSSCISIAKFQSHGRRFRLKKAEWGSAVQDHKRFRPLSTFHRVQMTASEMWICQAVAEKQWL